MKNIVYTLFLVATTLSLSYAQEGFVSTETKEVTYQERMIYDLGDGVFFDNNFEGARLNGVEKDGQVYKLLIQPENKPVNPSPWYSFRVWSNRPKDIKLQLVYEAGMHRYYPKVSDDGENWQPLDSASFSYSPMEAPFKLRVQTGDTVLLHSTAFMDVSVSKDTLWISSQELLTSKDNENWIKGLADKKEVEMKEVGKSKNNRSLYKLKIGNGAQSIVIFSRQHPPEVTGYLAMQSFVEYLVSKSDDAKEFRQQYSIYVYPMLNPDGVDEGHWRHSAGGVDLNRDWMAFNQEETSTVSNDVREIEEPVLFCIDFHSTWKDIFYTLPEDQESNMPVVHQWLENIDEDLPELTVISRSSPVENSVVSYKWVYSEKGADGLTYEVGDDTDRELLRRKAEVAAKNLIGILLTGQE